MRRLLAVASAVVLFQAASVAQAADVSFSINVGGPPIVIAQPPDFLYPAELGFGVAVGVPYDMFSIDGVYYVYRGGGWYRTSSYGGNWVKMRPRELPPALRRYKIGKIHEFRDREYRMYAKDRDHYRGKYFRPGKEGREGHREMKAPGHEGQRDMREHRPDERGGERKEQGHER
jgi:hypothetical protein